MSDKQVSRVEISVAAEDSLYIILTTVQNLYERKMQ